MPENDRKRYSSRMSCGLSQLAGLVLMMQAGVVFGGENLVALTGGDLIAGMGEDVLSDSVVVVSGERILCAGGPDDCAVPEDAEMVDVSGQWVMPGLVDAHVHFSQTGFYDGRPDAEDLREHLPYEQVQARQRSEPGRYLDAYVCAGVTGVFDVGGFTWSVDLARRVGEGNHWPEIAASGPLVTHWVPEILNLRSEKLMLSLDSVEDGRRAVREMAAMDADAVKSWFLPVREADQREVIDARVKAMGEEAAGQEIPLIVHATSLREAKVALRAGAWMLVHSVHDEPVDDEFIRLAVENDVIYVPTLIVSRGYLNVRKAFVGAEDFVIDDPHGCVDADTRSLLENAADFGKGDGADQSPAFRRMAQRIAAQEETMAANLRRVHEAGITIAAGSDAGNPGTLHGIALLSELEAMQAAGLEPAEIIKMATRNGARAMGREDEFGTIEAGKLANLVVVGADPTEDVGNLREIEGVMVRGSFGR